MTPCALYDVPAPAKINRFLHIIGKRDDGYHLLQSVFQLLDWADILHFELRRDGRIRRHDLTAELPARDLSIRAAEALQQAAGCFDLGVDLSIEKRLPWGAGLGGGSSDAATTLLALNRLWGLRRSRAELLQIAIELGADVPFFVCGRNAWVEGIGECLTPLDLPKRWFAVLKPQVTISTALIFSSPLLERSTSPVIVADFLAHEKAFEALPMQAMQKVSQGAQNAFCKHSEFGRNDLQIPAQAYSSEVTQALALLQSLYGNSRMTGSGSAVFSEVGTNDHPQVPWITGVTQNALPSGWVGRMCQSLAQHPLHEWA
jgi:4-diphosphocytidyl-2-C-methyl-D-erythritol kinase